MFAKPLSIPMLRALFTLILAAVVLVPSASGTCISLFPGESWEDGVGQDPACFRVDISEPSLLVFELQHPAAAPRAYLEGLGEGGCGKTLLHHSPSVLVARVGPGVYDLWVAAEDATQTLTPFRLRFDRLGLLTKGETDPEIELEPKPLAESCLGCLDLSEGETDPLIELEPKPLGVPCVGCLDLSEGETDPESELEPKPLVALELPISSDLSNIPGLGHEQLATLCDADRGASFLCARPISGQVFEGRLTDTTVFRFTVPRLGPVEIRADGVGVAELSDRDGQRLEVLTGEAGEIHGVWTLVPGMYFLQVEGGEGGRLSVGSPGR